MGKYINLFTDFGFKRLFGTEENKDLLIDFLNTLLHDEQTIEDISYLNVETLGKTIEDRTAIFDLYCENNKGEKFIVELQRAKQTYFIDRSIFYAGKTIVQQSEKGDWNYKLTSVYVICIMNFTFPSFDDDKVLADVVLYDTVRERKFYEKLRLIYLQVPNFNKQESELNNNFDKWLYILQNLSNLDGIPAKLQKVLFEKVFKIAEISNYSKKELAAYEQSLKELRDYNNTIATAKKEAREKGMQKGMEKGMQIGKEIGKEEGILETKIKGIKKALQREKLSIQEIAEDNEVSIDFVKQIKKELK